MSDEKQGAIQATPDPFGGSGGDIGSGPTGDVRETPGIVTGSSSRWPTLLTAGTALAVGIALGWAIWK